MKPKKLLFIIGGLIVVGIVVAVLTSLFPQMVKQDLAASASTVTPMATPLEPMVRARGSIEPARSATLAFETSGTIVEWSVKEGDTVKAGDVLGRLDTTKLDLALQEAQIDLETAQLRLTQAEKDLAQQQAEAELTLRTAEARLAQAKMRYPSLTAAEIRLQNAREAEAHAQDEYNKSLDRPWETVDEREAYRKGVIQAANDRKIAEAELASVRADQAANAQEVAVLEAEVAKAQLLLTKLAQGVDPTLAQDIERAQLRVAQAQADLALATLTAPFDGTVLNLYYRVGDWAQPGVQAVLLADLASLRIETTDLDEWSMTHIRIGSPAEVTFTAFDDKTATGHVTEIAPRGEALSGGDVMYRTIITLDEPDPDLRWGMTVRVTIPVEVAQ
ncbi:MAG TPA: efflux RND transporter periplasmic adaptor subunit [Anaerolineae bacterium]|nr:efflux RND transporter periplasmic adaptor subunit [Anaerolineae bacterium]HQK15090.1 efflux RND transporter periplasmic adaptor subunit [Anaerolineae bacterium]